MDIKSGLSSSERVWRGVKNTPHSNFSVRKFGKFAGGGKFVLGNLDGLKTSKTANKRLKN